MVQAECVGVLTREDEGGFHCRERPAQPRSRLDRRLVSAVSGEACAPAFDFGARVADALHARVGVRDPVAYRQQAAELLAEIVDARRGAGVVDHLEGLGERAVPDPEADLVPTRQHEWSPVRLLAGPVAPQPHCAGEAQVPHETVDAGPHRHPRTGIEGLVLFTQVVPAGGLRTELADEGAAGVVEGDGDGFGRRVGEAASAVTSAPATMVVRAAIATRPAISVESR